MIISKTKLPSNGETKDPVLKPVEPQSLIRLYHVNELYSIIDKVGRGTYGTVYKARGLKDGRYYAIKKLENNDAKLQQ